MADVRQIPQLLSDHPANGTRIQTLEKHFQDNPLHFFQVQSRPEICAPIQRSKGCTCAVPAR
jgi:beta-barrel assembly-enhancing protease